MSYLTIGAAWSWRGQARYLVETAARAVEWAGTVGASAAATLEHCAQVQSLPEEASGLLVLTNGAQTFTATLFPIAGESVPLLVFEGDYPARDQEFWISDITANECRADDATRMDNTVVAFPTRSKQSLVEPDHRYAITVGRRAD